VDADAATTGTHVTSRLFDFLNGILGHSLSDSSIYLLEFCDIVAAK
jgi:hypothetical protein